MKEPLCLSVAQCVVSVLQFVMELAMVANPSMTWLAVAVMLSLPSLVVESLEQLRSLGVRADTLYNFLVSCGRAVVNVESALITSYPL